VPTTSEELAFQSASLHYWHHIERAKVYGCIFNLFLNPADILLVGGNDSGFIELEELSEVLVLTREVPAEQTLDNPPHGLNIHVASESEIFIARCSKPNVHWYFVQPPIESRIAYTRPILSQSNGV
jgi:hypothetical protein